MSEIIVIEGLLNLDDAEIKQLYDSWDRSDCSLVGLTEIFSYQCIRVLSCV